VANVAKALGGSLYWAGNVHNSTRMASSALLRTSRLLNAGVPTSPPLLVAHKNAAAPLSAVLLQQQRTKSDSLQQIKSGRGGRSSFTGNVVTVFGASGFIGRYVVNRLAKEGNQVIIPYRGDPYEVHRLKVAGDLGQILFVPIDVRNQDSLLKAVRYSNWAINLIGRDWETKNFSFYDIHTDTARNIAKACKETGVDKLIHFSALMASPDPQRCLPKIGGIIKRLLPKSIPQTSASFLLNGSEFLRSKYHGELAVKEEFPEAIIFRPSDVYGHDDRWLRYFCSPWRRSRFGSFPFWKRGEQTIKAPISVHDIATAVMYAFHNKHIYGETFQCAGPHFYRMDAIIDYLLEATNFHTTHKRVDLFLHPHSWILLMYCNYMELLFLNRPQYTWEKFERDSISDALTSDYPTIEATLPQGHKLLTIDKVAPYDVKMCRRAAYFYDKMSIPNPAPPTPFVFPEDD